MRRWIGGQKVMVHLALITKEDNKHLEILQQYREEKKNGAENFRNNSIDCTGHS